ncbi:MAG TPA: hypothetical protein VMZ04_03740 [Anaerolineae bacterium]|nr:hypothetical protein [Anaerolineae bacterium]
MSDNNNIEILKWLVGIIIGLVGFISGINLKFLSVLKKTDEKIFDRLNGMDRKIEHIDTRCEERCKDVKHRK